MKSEQTQLAQKETALKQVLTYLLVTLPNPEQCTIIQHLQAEQKHVQQLLSNKVQFPSNQLFTINYVTIDPGNHHQSRDSTATESELKGRTILRQPEQITRATASTASSLSWCNLCWQPCPQVATGNISNRNNYRFL